MKDYVILKFKVLQRKLETDFMFIDLTHLFNLFLKCFLFHKKKKTYAMLNPETIIFHVVARRTTEAINYPLTPTES